MTVEPTPDVAPLERGRAALARGGWEDAVAALTAAVAADAGDAAAWESLGVAHAWLQQTDPAIDARQRAYALYRERGDDVSAARLSLELANDFLEARGEHAVANGWFQRARRLLEGLPPSREHALLRIWDAYMALLGDDDPVAAAEHARAAVELAVQARAADMGVLALALQGLAGVSEGRVPEGMQLLDEAVAGAIGGEFTDPQWFYLTCCCMIDACDRVRDYGRSLEWCHRLREFCERWRVQAFLTTCRIKFTGALLWRGDWQSCEAELERALAELTDSRPSGVPGAVVRLAELRRRQGRAAEAEALLKQAETHPVAAAVRAALALDAGDAATALELADLALRRIPEPARTERVMALEQKVRALASLGRLDQAHTAAMELEAIARVIDTKPIRAAAMMAAGVVARAGAEHDRARHLFEDAAWLLASAGSPPEAAAARLAVAECLAALGRHTAAASEATAALAVLEAVGAVGTAGRARALLDRLTATTDSSARPAGIGSAAAGSAEASEAAAGTGTASARGSGRRSAGVLTRRQREVLGLVAQGLSDRDIARRLFLSEHTVHRHVANILGRLGVSSRTAAVARALRDDLLATDSPPHPSVAPTGR
jgi:LuxR family transcriptional regulator, maltose regulon positive regulatory protein